MKTRYFLFFAFAITFIFNSCKTDFDLNETYKESVAVYGLLDQSDSVNYIRVNRVFLGKGDATVFAQMKDSVYFKPGEVSVRVEKYFNTTKKQTYIFSESYKPIQSGTFNTDQLIYRNAQPLRADSAGVFFTYKLVVVNNNTGATFTASTKLVKDFTSSNQCAGTTTICFFNQPANFSLTYPGTIKVKYGSTPNAKAAEFKMKFFYRDSIAGNTFIPRVVDIPVGTSTIATTNGGELVDFTFPAEMFYSTLENKIKDDPNVLSRRADSVNFYLSFAGEEFSLYNEINGTAGAFGQEKPIYTNIDNGGVGVFSSRYTRKIVRPYFNCHGPVSQPNTISYQSLDQLATGIHTCKLRFQKSTCGINYLCQ